MNTPGNSLHCLCVCACGTIQRINILASVVNVEMTISTPALSYRRCKPVLEVLSLLTLTLFLYITLLLQKHGLVVGIEVVFVEWLFFIMHH